jgi:hypothetical protein
MTSATGQSPHELLFKFGLAEDPSCSRCHSSNERTLYILCYFKSLARLTYHHYGTRLFKSHQQTNTIWSRYRTVVETDGNVQQINGHSTEAIYCSSSLYYEVLKRVAHLKKLHPYYKLLHSNNNVRSINLSSMRIVSVFLLKTI